MAAREEQKSAGQTKRLKLGPASWQTGGFNPSIKGVPVITHADEGVEVPADKVEAVKEAAKANDLTISEVKESGN